MQSEHGLSQLLDCHPASVAVMADIEVLTENTAQVTTAEKYSSGAAGTDEDTFLAEMRSHRANHRRIINTAKAGLRPAPIDFASAGTKCAGIHIVPQLPNGFTK